MRQITSVLTQVDMVDYGMNKINLNYLTLTQYDQSFHNVSVLFGKENIKNTLAEVISKNNLSQLHIAETEKYAHVTYFLNGGYANPVAGEARTAVLSPDVKFYDETPAMSSVDLTKIVIKNLTPQPPLLIRKGGGSRLSGRQQRGWKYDFTMLNFAAPDMIGHTGNLQAGIKCCEGVDKYLGKIVNAYLKIKGTVIITADHGNIEEMINLKTGEIDVEHSTNHVPFILVNEKLKDKVKLNNNGVLGDIAPTILELMGREKPREMTGRSLIK